jgi:hypothetical protein
MPEQRAGNALSILTYTSATRAAFVNLVEWVREGREPPPNAVPSIADGTALGRDVALDAIAAIPGATLPDRALLNDALVPAVDADGNDVPGIRLAELQVPVATSTGWNTRHPETGAPGQLADMLGSTLPFAPTRAAREAGRDPRPSLDERYGGIDGYRARVRAAAEGLTAERYILSRDIDRVVDTAVRVYERIRDSRTGA